MGIFSCLKVPLGRATAAPVKVTGLPFPELFLADPSLFRHGLELLNDAEMPLSFFLRELQDCVGLSAGDASVAAALCHSLGGVVVPLSSAESAASAARSLTTKAAAAGFQLRCKAVAVPENA
jgi:ATP-dependent Clp protease adapter protein ClpS